MRTIDQIKQDLLVLKAQSGDVSAFEELVDLWQQALWRQAFRITGDREAAREIVQDAWLTMLRNIETLNHADAFPAWAFRIVTHKARDWIRKQQRRRKLHKEYIDAQGKNPLYFEASFFPDESLQALLHELDSDSRMLVALYYEQEFSISEISEILILKPGTVKSRLYRIRQALRRRLEETGYERFNERPGK